MKHLFLVLLLVLISCETKDINFDYEKMAPSGVVIVNYYPVSQEQLKRYLTAVNDTLQYDSINVFLWAKTIQQINPEFKKSFFRSSIGQMTLKERSYDTAKIMESYAFHFGTFKGDRFKKADLYDSALLNGKFLLTK